MFNYLKKGDNKFIPIYASETAVNFNDWVLKSGAVSIRISKLFSDTKTEGLSLLFLGSAEAQTLHMHPINGTPVEVPHPRTNIFIYFYDTIKRILNKAYILQ